jgi:hypothetical protein
MVAHAMAATREQIKRSRASDPSKAKVGRLGRPQLG